MPIGATSGNITIPTHPTKTPLVSAEGLPPPQPPLVSTTLPSRASRITSLPSKTASHAKQVHALLLFFPASITCTTCTHTSASRAQFSPLPHGQHPIGTEPAAMPIQSAHELESPLVSLPVWSSQSAGPLRLRQPALPSTSRMSFLLHRFLHPSTMPIPFAPSPASRTRRMISTLAGEGPVATKDLHQEMRKRSTTGLLLQNVPHHQH